MRNLIFRSLLPLAFLPLASCGGQSDAGDNATGNAQAAQLGCTDKSRACLETVARSYIDALVSHDGSKIPLAADVRRTENALTNAKGEHEVRESFVRTHMVESTGDVRLYTDVEKGEVVAFFLLNVDLKEADANATTKAGDSDYKVAVTKPAGTYTVHEAERFKIVDGKIHEIDIIAHVEDGKNQGSGWPVERDAKVETEKK
ncbi:hypothetical protein [Sphingobium aromaticivastans]|uniref:hypothetical protein n=1 Tax=Sphingobium aromaticivastans TaxID=1778665 RepID=UPI003018A97F